MVRNKILLFIIILVFNTIMCSKEKKINIHYCKINISDTLKSLWHKNNTIIVVFDVAKFGMVDHVVVALPPPIENAEIKYIREEAEKCVKRWLFQGYTGKIGVAKWHWSFEKGWHPLFVKIGDIDINIDANPRDFVNTDGFICQEQ